MTFILYVETTWYIITYRWDSFHSCVHFEEWSDILDDTFFFFIAPYSDILLKLFCIKKLITKLLSICSTVAHMLIFNNSCYSKIYQICYVSSIALYFKSNCFKLLKFWFCILAWSFRKWIYYALCFWKSHITKGKLGKAKAESSEKWIRMVKPLALVYLHYWQLQNQ